VTAPGALAGWPVNLLVRGRRVVVVGAGRIAARKLAPLVALGADVVVVAPDVGDEVRAMAAAGTLQALHERPFAASDLDGAWLTVTATDDPAVNRAVHAAAEARHVWCNSADDPENCSFTLLSLVRRGDLVVAIGTGGRSPALAAELKRRYEAELGPEYATLLELLAAARDERQARGLSTETADWRSVFASGIVDLVRSGRVDEAEELLRTCL
jgi:precorrin-2 dehydrogenase / sirohydrochlorin ferrochelatase